MTELLDRFTFLAAADAVCTDALAAYEREPCVETLDPVLEHLRGVLALTAELRPFLGDDKTDQLYRGPSKLLSVLAVHRARLDP